jgi:hypothetical protein
MDVFADMDVLALHVDVPVHMQVAVHVNIPVRVRAAAAATPRLDHEWGARCKRSGAEA